MPSTPVIQHIGLHVLFSKGRDRILVHRAHAGDEGGNAFGLPSQDARTARTSRSGRRDLHVALGDQDLPVGCSSMLSEARLAQDAELEDDALASPEWSASLSTSTVSVPSHHPPGEVSPTWIVFAAARLRQMTISGRRRSARALHVARQVGASASRRLRSHHAAACGMPGAAASRVAVSVRERGVPVCSSPRPRPERADRPGAPRPRPPSAAAAYHLRLLAQWP